MESFKCEIVTTNSLMAKVPEPPSAIKDLLEDYQNFLDSIFAKEYKTQNYNPAETIPLYNPQLTEDEQHYIETLKKNYTRCQNGKNTQNNADAGQF